VEKAEATDQARPDGHFHLKVEATIGPLKLRTTVGSYELPPEAANFRLKGSVADCFPTA
jgi:hypothetical protein